MIPILIGLLPDPERYVAITAQQSLGILTQHETELHDWHISTPEQRAQWATEWLEWWKTAEATFEFPEPRKRRSRT